jgi:hypothetical protein
VLGSVSMVQSKVDMGGCHDPKGKCHRNVIEMALLQMLADSLRIWYTARRDTLLVRNKILETYMPQLLQEIVVEVAQDFHPFCIVYSSILDKSLCD